MAKTRQVNTRFWDDDYIMELDPSGKLLFLYLITNPLTDLCGAYQITVKRMSFDTGLKPAKITELLGRFQADGKMMHKDGWLIIRNFGKHQQGSSPKVALGIERSLSACPDWVKHTVLNGIDTLSIPSRTLTYTCRDNLYPVGQPKPEPSEAAAAVAATDDDPVEARIWRDGRDLLKRSGVRDPGSLLGKWVKDHGKEAAAMAIASAQATNAADPKSYIFAVLNRKKNGNGAYVGRSATDEKLPDCPECNDLGYVIRFGDDWQDMKQEPCTACRTEAVAA